LIGKSGKIRIQNNGFTSNLTFQFSIFPIN